MFLMPKFVGSLKSCVDSDSSRYAINGVQLMQLDERSARAEATNGRILCRMEWDHDNPFEFPQVNGFDPHKNGVHAAVAPIKSIVEACKAIPKRTPRPIMNNAAVTLAEDNVVFATTNLESSSVQPTKCIDGRWPKTDDVIPDHADAVTKILIDPRELSKLLEPFVATAEDENAAVELTVKDRFSAMKISRKNTTANLVGVIMPLVAEAPAANLTETRRLYHSLYLELHRTAGKLVELLTSEQLNDDEVNNTAEVNRINDTRDYLANHEHKE